MFTDKSTTGLSKTRGPWTVPPWRIRIALGALGLGVVGTMGVLRLTAQSQVTSYVVPPEAPPTEVGDQKFPESVQAESYRTAMVDGQTRSVTLLENALRLAQAQDPVDEAAVRRLKLELSSRKRVLASVVDGVEASANPQH